MSSPKEIDDFNSNSQVADGSDGSTTVAATAYDKESSLLGSDYVLAEKEIVKPRKPDADRYSVTLALYKKIIEDSNFGYEFPEEDYKDLVWNPSEKWNVDLEMYMEWLRCSGIPLPVLDKLATGSMDKYDGLKILNCLFFTEYFELYKSLNELWLEDIIAKVSSSKQVLVRELYYSKMAEFPKILNNASDMKKKLMSNVKSGDDLIDLRVESEQAEAILREVREWLRKMDITDEEIDNMNFNSQMSDGSAKAADDDRESCLSGGSYVFPEKEASDYNVEPLISAASTFGAIDFSDDLPADVEVTAPLADDVEVTEPLAGNSGGYRADVAAEPPAVNGGGPRLFSVALLASLVCCGLAYLMVKKKNQKK